LASSVGSKLKAHSGLCRIETWKSLKIMSDKASVLDNVSAALESVTPRRQSMSLNWVLLREPRAPTVKLACEQFQGRPLRAPR